MLVIVPGVIVTAGVCAIVTIEKTIHAKKVKMVFMLSVFFDLFIAPAQIKQTIRFYRCANLGKYLKPEWNMRSGVRSYELWVMSYKLWVMSYKLWVMSYELSWRTTGLRVEATSYLPRRITTDYFVVSLQRKSHWGCVGFDSSCGGEVSMPEDVRILRKNHGQHYNNRQR